MGNQKGSKETIPPESVVINPDDIGQLSEVIPVEEAEAPREAPKEEKTSLSDEEIVTGSVPDNLRKRFLQVYRALESISDEVRHSPGSKRYHFKPFSVVLFYSKSPVVDCAVYQGPKTKHTRIRFKLTDKGMIGADEKSITIKDLQKIARAYKKAKGK